MLLNYILFIQKKYKDKQRLGWGRGCLENKNTNDHYANGLSRDCEPFMMSATEKDWLLQKQQA
jgi:hypothetical protein